MIKAKGTMDGREVLILGLSDDNLNSLRTRNPLVVNGDEINIPFDMIIFSQATEQVMADTLSGFLAPGATIHVPLRES